MAALRLRFAIPPTGRGSGDYNALTASLDHPIGTAHERAGGYDVFVLIADWLAM